MLLLMVQIPFEELGPAKISKRAPSAPLPTGRLTPPTFAVPSHDHMPSSTSRLSQHIYQGDALHVHQSLLCCCTCLGPAVLCSDTPLKWLV